MNGIRFYWYRHSDPAARLTLFTLGGYATLVTSTISRGFPVGDGYQHTTPNAFQLIKIQHFITLIMTISRGHYLALCTITTTKDVWLSYNLGLGKTTQEDFFGILWFLMKNPVEYWID